MYFTEFLVLMLVALAVVWLLLVLSEKVICQFKGLEIHRIIRLMISLAFVYGLLLITAHYFYTTFQMTYFLIAGGIILLNKYWFGYFHSNQHEDSRFSAGN